MYIHIFSYSCKKYIVTQRVFSKALKTFYATVVLRTLRRALKIRRFTEVREVTQVTKTPMSNISKVTGPTEEVTFAIEVRG